MARRITRRSKSKKGVNRYNPNSPDWSAVHGAWWQKGILRLGSSGILAPLVPAARRTGN